MLVICFCCWFLIPLDSHLTKSHLSPPFGPIHPCNIQGGAIDDMRFVSGIQGLGRRGVRPRVWLGWLQGEFLSFYFAIQLTNFLLLPHSHPNSIIIIAATPLTPHPCQSQVMTTKRGNVEFVSWERFPMGFSVLWRISFRIQGMCTCPRVLISAV